MSAYKPDGYPSVSVYIMARGGQSVIDVPDVDATYQRALAAGGSSIQAPSQRDGDPDKRGGVADPSGNQWWISTQVS